MGVDLDRLKGGSYKHQKPYGMPRQPRPPLPHCKSIQSVQISQLRSDKFFLLDFACWPYGGTLNPWWRESVEPWTCHWVAPPCPTAWPPPPKLIQNLHPQPALASSQAHARPDGGKKRKTEHRAWIVDAAVAAVRSTVLFLVHLPPPTVCQTPAADPSLFP